MKTPHHVLHSPLGLLTSRDVGSWCRMMHDVTPKARVLWLRYKALTWPYGTMSRRHMTSQKDVSGAEGLWYAWCERGINALKLSLNKKHARYDLDRCLWWSVRCMKCSRSIYCSDAYYYYGIYQGNFYSMQRTSIVFPQQSHVGWKITMKKSKEVSSCRYLKYAEVCALYLCRPTFYCTKIGGTVYSWGDEKDSNSFIYGWKLFQAESRKHLQDSCTDSIMLTYRPMTPPLITDIMNS